MLVRATQLGFDGMKRRKPGEVFEVPSSAAFTKAWMEMVKEDAAETPAPSPTPTVIPEEVQPRHAPGTPRRVNP